MELEWIAYQKHDKAMDNKVDISPESKLYVTIQQKRRITLPSRPKPVTVQHEIKPLAPQESASFDFTRHHQLCDTSSSSTVKSWKDVSTMLLDDLIVLEQRVLQMEESNMNLLTRIYGPFTPDRKPFPLISQIVRSSYPICGGQKHRKLVHAQYDNMRSVATDPTGCVNKDRPSTVAGGLLLQDYHMQLLCFDVQLQRKTLSNRVLENNLKPPKSSSDVVTDLAQKDQSPEELVTYSCQHSALNSYTCGPVQDPPDSLALLDYGQQLQALELMNKRRLQMNRCGPVQDPSENLILSDYERQLRALEVVNHRRLQMKHDN